MATFHCAETIAFPTIHTDFIGPLLLSKCYLADATHDEEGRCGAGGHPKSGLIRTDTTLKNATIDNESMALMLCPSALSAPTLMRNLYAYNAILQTPHTMRRVDVVLAATPNQASS